jgi:thiosulfate/3-mercaptopyruvate sulfurtransferase
MRAGIVAAVGGHADTGLRYVRHPAEAGTHPRLLDTRPEADCLANSASGAVCLPPEAFFGPHRRLASFRDISWVLGSAGLRGDETLLVLGNDPVRRDAVAALLYLSGQSQVAVLEGRLDHQIDAGLLDSAAGRARGILRDPIHTGTWREERILLRGELAQALANGDIARLLDGRTADEYWGERIRARRGGHLPGAELAPAAQLRAAVARGESALHGEQPLVAYAHDPLTGLAYLTLLRAGLGLDVTLYLGGWREWAEDGRLPADAVSYAEPRATPGVPRTPLSAGHQWLLTPTLLTLAALAGAGAFGYLLGKRTS